MKHKLKVTRPQKPLLRFINVAELKTMKHKLKVDAIPATYREFTRQMSRGALRLRGHMSKAELAERTAPTFRAKLEVFCMCERAA